MKIQQVIKAIFRSMKITESYEHEKERKQAEKYAEWGRLYAHWISIHKEDSQAVQKTADLFGCSKNKVLSAISYHLKFHKL